MAGPIASAVVLPEQDLEPTASPPNSHKRRQSSTLEQEAKRPRFDDDSIHPDRRNSVNNTKPTAPPKGRERGRERRLFGAALGALSQNSATAGQKRRSEIEKRQQAQRRLQDEESEQRKLERQAKRKAQRWKEQKRLEQDSMRVRHNNLLATAHFLQTTSEPRLYYKPWETTPEEDDRIRNQIAEANETIRRDLNMYEHREEDAGRERDASREGQPDHTADASHSGKESNAEAPLEPTTANDGPTNRSERQPKDPEQTGDHADDFANKAVSEERAAVDAHSSNVTSHEIIADESSKEVDENGEEVVEATEDTVIY